jgi:hypothetical protein
VGSRTYYPYVGGPEPSRTPRRGPSTVRIAVVGYGLLVAGALLLFLLARA